MAQASRAFAGETAGPWNYVGLLARSGKAIAQIHHPRHSETGLPPQIRMCSSPITSGLTGAGFYFSAILSANRPSVLA